MTTPYAAATIAAQAFRFMEMAPISSFDDDSEQARAAASEYPNALLECLEAGDWSFASTLVTVGETELPETVTADPALPYLYTLPGDLVRLREVTGTVRWRIDRAGLRADTPEALTLRYTAAIEDETTLPATFRLAVALRLAFLLAPRWVATASKIDALDARFQSQLKKALREDSRTAREARYDGLPDQPDWVEEARY